MGKILSIVLLLVVLVPASGQKDNSMRNMKNWQVKGLAKSAIRLGDPWQASIYLEELYRRKPSDEVGLMLGRNLMASDNTIRPRECTVNCIRRLRARALRLSFT